ncbi:hypothetical protein [Pseudomonas violetae]|uniref:Lipoprotein n=1 Tax=Pseudomonas violetae TaxID=2915813 RepID=A0ABT0ESI9_9PSED|nr:hypothetical protein [Pseudomonas violetae]MCK1788700.1 hypothetical protein [Pseudomonas violetae]
MRKLYRPALLATLLLCGCAPSVKDLQDQSQLSGANNAVLMANYQNAEKLLGQYVYRDRSGRLKVRSVGISADNRKHAIDTVVQLLWETGRDESLQQFAGEYLTGREYQTTMCRISERQARFEEAYHCWNDMGEATRAERVIATEAALQILGSP